MNTGESSLESVLQSSSLRDEQVIGTNLRGDYYAGNISVSGKVIEMRQIAGEACSTAHTHYMVAGFRSRLLAYLLDSIFLTLVALVAALSIGILAQLDGPEMLNAATTALTVMTPLYLVAFWATMGATPGKIMLSMGIVGPDGHVGGIGWARAFLRLFGYVVSSFFFYLGFIWIAVDPEKRGWHDRIAGTRVVHL